MNRYGYIHLYINHSLRFVSEINNEIHTNTIERSWRSLKLKIKKESPRIYLDTYLTHFLFESYAKYKNRYVILLNMIKELN